MKLLRPHLRLFSLAAALAVLLTLPAAAPAADVADYRERIAAARLVLKDLITELVEHSGLTAIRGFDASKVNNIRTLVPASETIETPEGPVQTSNAWVHSRLDEYITLETVEARAAVLLEIDERLASIQARLAVDETSPAAGVSKDEQKRQLRDILAREEFQKPSDESESWLTALINRIVEWLRSLFPDVMPVPSPASQTPSVPWFQYVIIGILAVFIGFMLYRLAPLVLPAFRRKAGDDRKERVILGEKIGSEESAASLFSEAESLARSGDLRGAIRKGYIALLCEFSDRRLIGLARHKTNRDYLRDIRTSPVHETAASLTGQFESHWYGGVPTSDEDWEQFRRQYKEAVAGI